MIKMSKENSMGKFLICESKESEIEFKQSLDTYSKEDLMDAIINFLRDLGFNV